MVKRSLAVRELEQIPIAAITPELECTFAELDLAFANGQILSVISKCEEMLGLIGENAGVRYRLAGAYRANGQIDQAVSEYRRVISLEPRNHTAHTDLGNTLTESGALVEGAAFLERALELEPTDPAAMLGLLRTCRHLGDQKRSAIIVSEVERRASDEPCDAAWQLYLGLAYSQVDRHAAALESLLRASELQPSNPFILNLIGMMLEEDGRTEEALHRFEAAMKVAPEDAEIRFNVATALLRLGDLERGFREYECRWRSPRFPSPRRTFKQPMWAGEELGGRTILLHTEQGLGDTIQFIRYSKLVAERGGSVVVECEPALERLIAGCAGVGKVVRKQSGFRDFDVHCPLMSLPHLFGTALESIPADVPYLRAPGAAVPLPHRDGSKRLRIGIAWEGSRTGANFRNKSCPLDLFEPLVQNQALELYSLQKGPGVDDLLAHPMHHYIHEIGSGFTDLADTAQAIGQLDLVISVDTAVAHLAGGLGVPTWLLLSCDNDWRWLMERDDSPWYPSMRLFRQEAPRDWASVSSRVTAEVARLCESADAAKVGSVQAPATVLPKAQPITSGDLVAQDLLQQGIRFQLAGELDQAEESYRRALAADPRSVRAHANLGVVVGMRGDIDAAFPLLHQALELDPEDLDALNNLGVLHLQRREFGKAANYFHRAATLGSHLVDPLRNLAVTLREGGNPAASEALLREALDKSPEAPALLGNLASAVYEQGKLEQAERIAQRTLGEDASNYDALLVLANCAMERLDFEKAKAYVERAIASNPADPSGYWNRGFVRLLEEDYQGGWEDYETRWRLLSAARDDVIQYEHRPRWDGSSLDGRSILLHVEQGLGDAIQFIRFAPVLKKKWDVRVIVECYPALVRLFQTCPGIDEVVPRGEPAPPTDLQAAMMGLPRLLGTTVDSLGDHVPYLSAGDTELSLRVRGADGLKVGIVWAGNPGFRRDARRSLHASLISHLAAIPGVRLYSLQVGGAAAQLPNTPFADRVTDLGSEIAARGGDLTETAAVINELDLVISTCTSVPHLSGALGKETWIMLPYLPDWRWFMNRTDSPWYPSARLFRQPRMDDWASVIHDVTEELRQRARAKNPGISAEPPQVGAVAPSELQPEIRSFLAEQMDSGDVWISVGTTDGVEALAAASVPDRSLRAIAITYNSEDAERVLARVKNEHLTGAVEVAFAKPDRLPLPELATRAVRVTGGRVFLRIHEADEAADVLSQAGDLLESGQLAAVVWDMRDDSAPDGIVARTLEAFGYTLLRVAATPHGPELVPSGVEEATGSVFALSEAYLAAALADTGAVDGNTTIRNVELATPAHGPGTPNSAPAETSIRVPKLVIDWQAGTQSGWGVYGLNLALHAIRSGRAFPVLLSTPDLTGVTSLQQRLLKEALEGHRQVAEFAALHGDKSLEIEHPVLRALGNGLGSDTKGRLRGKHEIGVVFFEDTAFDSAAIQRGRAFDRIIAGSSWNAEVLRANGLDHVAVCLQGIDPTVFHPGPRSGWLGDRFVIFSGGKLEYRKGQDLVIAAFREFHRRHPDALLMVAWHNHWPHSMAEITTRGHVRGVPEVSVGGRLEIGRWLVSNGVPEDAFVDLGLATNFQMGQLVREADVALFPNRCEGGTNLVAMECLASGVPSILSANTGHLDLIDAECCFALADQGNVAPTRQFRGVEGWGESSIEEIIATLETVYSDREEARRRAEAGSARMLTLSWERQIGQLLTALQDFF